MNSYPDGHQTESDYINSKGSKVSIFFMKCQKMSTKTVQDTALMGEDVPFFVTL